MSIVVSGPDDLVVTDLLRRGFHSVVFQPIRRLADGSIFGFEALMRGPAGTPLAEPSRIFRQGALSPAVLHRVDLACFFSALRLGRFLAGDQTLFVNLHGETLLRYAKGADEVARLLDQLAIDPRRLVIEVSEMTDRAHARGIGRSFRSLRRSGVRVALDDIGSRYAWLHHMLWLEPDFLKLDRSFVRGSSRSARGRELIAGVVSFARGSCAEVVAEGIEEESERDLLCAAGVALGQGYWLGKPLPVQQWFPAEAEASSTRVAGLIE
jgi:EAL domain-containing protein (putative c-di-GMP-specific phosphodiesterase class I)